MSALQDAVRRTMVRHHLCPPGTRLLVALSGGSDSVALLYLMRELAAPGGHAVVGLAHFNHQLRSEADRDEAFCVALAARLGLPCQVGRGDVRSRATADGLSVEDAARRERYAFLEQAAAAAGATRIATGHTRDDQAETFLLKLARGAGLSGLGGIYPMKGSLVRPLLGVTRADLQAFLRGHGETWVEDATNADLDNPRNRVRHVVLPLMRDALGPAVDEAIARSAALAAEDGAWLDAQAAAYLDGTLNEPPDEPLDEGGPGAAGWPALDADTLGTLPRPLVRRVVWQVMRRQTGHEVGSLHVDGALDVLEGRVRAAETPAGRWELLGGKLVLLPVGGSRGAPARPAGLPGPAARRRR